MPDTASSTYDVLIVGAGPTGLFLACELGLAGCSVLVLDSAPDPHTPSKIRPFGLRGLTVPTIENLARRGLLDALRRHDQDLTAWPEQHQRRSGGHFAGIDFFYDELASSSLWCGSLPVPTMAVTMAVTMASIEAVLADRARSLGVEIRRGVRVEGVTQTENGVVVAAGSQAFHGLFAVGCDGARSMVRKAAGIRFAGTEPEFTGYSVQVTLSDPAALEPGRDLAPGGVIIFAPPETIWMADFDGGAAHRAVPLDRDHVEAVLRKVSGRPVGVTTLHQATSWTDRACLAGAYRNGKILLAGDAAHIHSPLGGQGLNLGLGDAVNLGWKLASVVRGGLPAEILDTYGSERRPVAARVLDRSRAQVALLRPDDGSRALEAIMRDLIATRDGTTYFAERVSAVDLRYDLGCAHSLVGRSLPIDASATALIEPLRSGRGVLLDFCSDPALRAVADRSGGRVLYVAGVADQRIDVRAVLIRPDGIVAWVKGFGDIEAIMHRWFGSEHRGSVRMREPVDDGRNVSRPNARRPLA